MDKHEILRHCEILNLTPIFFSKRYSSQDDLDRDLDEFRSLVKRKYRSLIKKKHPDRINGDEEAAKRLITSYNALKDLKLVLRPRFPQLSVLVTYEYSTWDQSNSTSSSINSTVVIW